MIVVRNSQKGTLLGVAVIIAGGVVAGWLLGRGEAGPSAAPAAGSVPGNASPTVMPAASTAAEAPAISSGADDVATLAAASMSGARQSRLDAIARLAKVPRDQAIEPLRRVLLNGEPGVDRPAALVALRELALAQGDGDQRIQDAVREAIYHGDDEAFAAEAQATLDAIAQAGSK